MKKILAIDVDYKEGKAFIAGVIFNTWQQSEPTTTYFSILNDVEEYEPGNFYKREMPCILKLIEEHNLEPDIIIVDGFVTLGKNQRPGLGVHLYNALEQKIPVIGVAKTPFKDSDEACFLYRGTSEKPLSVTAIGVCSQKAKQNIASMHGEHRNPTLLKAVDRACRDFAKQN